MRRAGRARQRLSAKADRARPSRRGLRAARRPRRGEEARREIRRAARRDAARHARHHHRGDAARSRPPKRLRGAGARFGAGRRLALWARLRRYFDRRLYGRGARGGRSFRRTGAAGAARDRRRGDALSRRFFKRNSGGARRAGDAARPRRRRGRLRRAPADGVLRRRDAGGLWRADAGGACRLRLRHPLCRAHAKGRAAGAGAALEPARQQDARHRRRDQSQSRNLADALRRARGVAALRRRSHGDAGRGAAAG